MVRYAAIVEEQILKTHAGLISMKRLFKARNEHSSYQ